jgi:NAD(P)-dependent dehydrogenase (short-subunit alcohol dehydrogenase family)
VTPSSRVALVTGAGRGIGRVISLSLADAGIDLILMARTPDELRQTLRDVRARGREGLAIVVDISRREKVQEAVTQGLETFGHIDILVNNAGAQSPIGPLAGNDPVEWIQTVATNLFGAFFCLQAVLPSMIARRQGKIINLSGGGATGPRPNFSAYAASKAAVVRLTETVAEEVRPHNIQVNAVAPGAVNTRMLDEVLAAGAAAGDEEADARERKAKGGTPAEMAAELVRFLISEAANGLSGKLISAPYDDWRNWDANHIAKLANSSWYTLRRLDAFTLRSLRESAK